MFTFVISGVALIGAIWMAVPAMGEYGVWRGIGGLPDGVPANFAKYPVAIAFASLMFVSARRRHLGVIGKAADGEK